MFKEVGMATHFQELTTMRLIDSFLATVDKKGPRLLNFYKCIDAQKHKRRNERSHTDGCFFYWLISVRRKCTCSRSLRRRALLRKFGWRVCHQHPILLSVVSKRNKSTSPLYGYTAIQNTLVLLTCFLSF